MMRSVTTPISFLLGIFLVMVLTTMPAFGERLPVTTFTSADGLGSGFVNYLMRDSRGFMWFCTRDGLSRFDGFQFVTYQIGETGVAPGVEAIYETRDGKYWVSTTSGTYRFDPNSETGTSSKTGIINAEFVSSARGSFLQDRHGTLWIASGRLMKYEEIDGKPAFTVVDLGITERPNVTLSMLGMTESPDGSLWVLTTWSLVRRLPDGRTVQYSFERELLGGSGSVSLINAGGLIWLSLVDSVFLIKPEAPTEIIEPGPIISRKLNGTRSTLIADDSRIEFPQNPGEIVTLETPGIEGGYVRRLFESSDGAVWITSADRLVRIINGSMRIFPSSEGLPVAMSRMAEDSAGNLWIGGNAVLARMNRTGLVTYRKEDGAYSSLFAAVTIGPNGRAYFANDDAFFATVEGNRIRSVRPDVPKGLLHIWTSKYVFVDSRWNYWLLSTGALYRFDGSPGLVGLPSRAPSKVYTKADGLKSDGMFQIFEDRKGTIWVSTRGASNKEHGLARLDRDSDRFVQLTESDGLPNQISVSAFAEDRDGNLWISFYEGGIARIGLSGIKVFKPGEVLPASTVSDLHIDSKNRLWIASTTIGLLRVDDPAAETPVFTAISTAEGLSSNNLRTITEDRLGRIYIGTARGIDRYDPESGHIKKFTTDDGLAADFVTDSAMDGNGDLWFVTHNGVSRLTPTQNESGGNSPVFIGGIRVAGIDQPLSLLGVSESSIPELSHSENNIQIDFFGVDFRASEKLKFQYKLDGTNADWSTPTEDRSVAFANLSPGDYRFLVRAVSSTGRVSEKPAMLNFSILPPIWARWWFIVLTAFALAVLVWMVYTYRIARLREVNSALEDARLAEEMLRRSREDRLAELEQVRSRIATDLHDDIGASLTQIAILSEVARTKAEMNGAGAPLNRITEVSNELVRTMSDIVWSINPSKDHFSDLTQRMRRFASDSLTASGIHFRLNVVGSDLDPIVNSNLRREVFLIFKESINNILRHSQAKNVGIDVRIDDTGLELEVTDDGCGFDSEVLAKTQQMGGTGLVSLRRRAESLGGKLQIESIPGKGTRLHLTVRLDAAATQAGGYGMRTGVDNISGDELRS